MARFSLPRPTLSQRVLAAFLVVVAFAIGSPAYLYVLLQSLEQSAAEEQRIAKAEDAAYQLDIATLGSILALNSFVSTGQPRHLGDLTHHRNRAIEESLALRSLTTLPDVVDALNRYDELLPKRVVAADLIVEAVQSGEVPDLERLRAERRSMDQKARELLGRILTAQQTEIDRVAQRGAALRARVKTSVLTMSGVGGLILTSLLYSLVLAGVTQRLRLLTDMARRIAAGDFSRRIFVAGNDEIGVLANTLNTMAQQLVELDKVKEDFVALASHQLRTPATAVKGSIGLLLEGYCGELTEEQRETLADANASNERQLAVIDDMLWVARSDSGRLVLAKAPTDLGRLLAQIVAEQQHVAKDRQQQLRLEKPPGDSFIEADAQKLRMVFDNLISNASKYTPEKGAIRVVLERRDDGVSVAVSDTGVGIAPEDFPALFKKFSRIANPLSAKVGGTGLGLYLAREIVRLHGGDIEVRSTLGSGTTFLVTLPAR